MILISLIVSTLLVSCGSGTEKSTTVNFKVGTPEIAITLPKEKEEYQNRPFDIAAVLQNNMAYDISNVKVSLLGLDERYIDLFSNEESVDLLEGKSVFNSDGGKEIIKFNGLIKEILPGAEQEQQNYRIYVSYNSKIEFTPTICISPELYGEVYQGGCEVKPELFFSGQGAPLAVSELKLASGEASLRMTIVNKGKGTVKKVTLGRATLGGKPITCEFRGNDPKVFTFGTEKEAQLLCSQIIQSESSYQTALFVELFYDYELNEKGTMTILK
ncbi:MAG: hypothetical protein AB1668_05825 [Nanoarchaeota archaeon]